jgi:hypothetical protein
MALVRDDAANTVIDPVSGGRVVVVVVSGIGVVVSGIGVVTIGEVVVVAL